MKLTNSNINKCGVWWASPPSYEIRCGNIFSNVQTGILIEANSVMDDLGTANKPSDNVWGNVSNEIQTTNIINYYTGQSETINNPIGPVIIHQTNNSCQ